jgi:hypothetical protein
MRAPSVSETREGEWAAAAASWAGPRKHEGARREQQACGGSGLHGSLGRPKLAEQANQAAKVRRVSDSFCFFINIFPILFSNEFLNKIK